MKHTPAWQRAEINLAKRKWTGVAAEKLTELRKFVERYHFFIHQRQLVHNTCRTAPIGVPQPLLRHPDHFGKAIF